MATQDPADLDINKQNIAPAEDSQEIADDDLQEITGGIFSTTGVTDTTTVCVSL